MPILRKRVQAFTRQWNDHPIQKQPSRPYMVKGKPYMNYKHATVEDLRCNIDTDPQSEQAQYVQSLR